MSDLSGSTSRLRTVFTWLFIRVLKRTELKEIKQLQLLDEPVTVFVVEKDTGLYGQVTPVGTIIWNEGRTSELPQDAKKYVLLHERSHQTRNPIYKGIVYGMIFCAAVGLAYLMILPASTLVFNLLGMPASFPIYSMSLCFGLFTLALIVFRIEETWADYDALRELGIDHFQNAREEIKTGGNRTIRDVILRSVLYTSTEHTIRLYETLHER